MSWSRPKTMEGRGEGSKKKKKDVLPNLFTTGFPRRQTELKFFLPGEIKN